MPSTRFFAFLTACAGLALAGHIPIDISNVANTPWSIFTGGNTMPTGNQQYNGIPFNIPSGKSNAYIGWSDVSHATTTATIAPNVFGATTVYTLINTVWGQNGPQSYYSVTFTGSSGATYTRNLIGGVDIRDFWSPSAFLEYISFPTVNAWTGSYVDGIHFHRLDQQTFTLPPEFAGQTLISIKITDTGDNLSEFQRGVLAAVTVDGVTAPSGLTITSGDKQTGIGGTTLSGKLTVMVSGSSGLKIPGVKVNFAVTSGSATLSAASALTDTNGIASVTATLGPTGGNVTVTASIDGSLLPSVQFTLTALDPKCPIGKPTITSVRSATDFGGLASFAPGSWLEIKGTNLTLNTTPRSWAAADFQGPRAPVSLDGTSVSINGIPGYVSYISSGQVNAQAPASAMMGSVPVTVTTCGGTSSPFTTQETAVAPGLLAPASFNIGGKQYLAATFLDGVTFVGSPGLIPGAALRPAKSGETIIAYGIGFGPVTPDAPPGLIVSEANSVANLSIGIGGTPASTLYAGLAANFIGLYEFYIVVPNLPDGDYPVSFTVAGIGNSQTLYLTVHK